MNVYGIAGLPMGAILNTVLVLGAGASHEVGLPIGYDLKKTIAKALPVSANGGDESLRECFRLLAKGEPGFNLNPWYHASRQIVGGMPLSPSIDNFLHQRGCDDPNIEICGKLAIVSCILSAELHSSLALQDGSVNLDGVENTWFNEFCMLLVSGCKRADLPGRFKQVAVVSFNYDRCFEQFLVHFLMRFYSVDETEAARLARQVQVYHPYGQVGYLPWQLADQASPKVSYGGTADPDTLLKLAKEVKTFTEGMDPISRQFIGVQRAMGSAERLVYLGFGYHDQNMEVLYKARVNASGRSCWGTAYKMSGANTAAVLNDLRSAEGHDQVVLADQECAPFIRNHSRSFRFR